mmetsp:Transcript_5766/g.10978  ORF Transcript_5766/g.10978 Transcript_5766/m.10978 type:complete len:391 (+) Transcript_5766:26-1198(+)
MMTVRFIALSLCVATTSAACYGQTGVLDNPKDPRDRGPYPVSSRLLEGTFTDRNLTVEVFFPAIPGSEAGAKPLTLDVRDFLSPDIAKKIPSKDVPIPFYNNSWVDLPPAWKSLDKTVAGFPLITFIHGTAGWRSQSLSLVVHWASRGFVVVAADYPGICLKDLLLLAEHPLQPHPKEDQVGDTKKLQSELFALTDPRLKALLGGGAVNVTNNALIGHSAGALALEKLGGFAAVVIPLAGDGSAPDGNSPAVKLRSTLVLGAYNDTEVPPLTHAEPGYKRSPTPKRMVIGANMGHQAFSDLCYIGEAQGGISGIGEKLGIWEAYAFAPLAVQGCKFHNSGFFEPQKNWALIEFATSAVLEETLRCDAQMSSAIADIKQKFDYVFEYKQDI